MPMQCMIIGKISMTLQKGDVVLVSYPYTDLITAKTRPAVVISSDNYHIEKPDIILSALTTNISSANSLLDYILKDWSIAGLKFPTAFKPVIVTIDPSLVIYHIGSLSVRDLNEIHNRLRLIMDL